MAEPMTDEEFLEDVRRTLANGELAGRATYPGPAAIEDMRRVIAHIDFLEGAMADLLDTDGRLLREQGAAEERARITEAILSLWESVPLGLSTASLFKAALACVGREALPDLLPPLESAARLAEAERKAATMRAALETIRDNDMDRDQCYENACKALEDAR